MRILRRFKDISIAKKLYFTVGIMALLIAVELFTLYFAINTLSSVRAYVGGEGLWSKAQKDAIYHLEKYGYTGNELDYAQFLKFMEVSQGDHVARLEMEKEKPDFAAARRGFIAGRNHPDDVEGMTKLFRRFYSISFIKKASSIWSEADDVSIQLMPIGESLHREISSGAPSQEKISSLLRQIDPVNYRLTKLEDDFSYTLGEGSRWLENLVLKILFCLALTVEISGLLLTISVSRGIQKGLNEIIRVSKIIARGEFTERARKYSEDEIGALADSFNRMASELEQNINERNRSRMMLKESEERFRLLVENVNDYAIYMVDPSGKIMSWNDGAERINGYSANEIIGKHISVFYTEEQIRNDEPQANLEMARKLGNFQVEAWRKQKNGSLIWVDILFSVLHDDHGQMRGYATITRDITERKMVENALKRSQEQLSMAQQLAHLGSWEWDPHKNIITWSDELYRIYGIEPSKNSLEYDEYLSMIHPADRIMAKKEVAEAIRQRSSFSYYHRIVRKDLSERVIHAMGKVVTDEEGQVVKLYGTGQDVTERSEEEKMEKLALAATKSNNSVLIADPSGKIEWVNEGFTKLTGYTFDEVKNTHYEILDKSNTSFPAGKTGIYDTLINEKKSVVYEGKNYTKSGQEYWVITTITPMLGKNGMVERIIAIDSDITERKLIEKDLILANQIADHSLKKGNKALRELMNAKKQLEESMHVKEQFLAKMSHEIRTPMNAIIGFTEILLEGKITPEQKECLEGVKLSSDNLLSIINDILDFSKLESGTVSLDLFPFKLKELIDGVVYTLRYTANRKAIALEYSLDKMLPEFVVGDQVRLRQILLNLVGNSVKFTERGSVTVHVGLHSETEDDLGLRFVVSDTGIGIPKDRLSTIFDSFTQASNETSRKYGGTGLGLTIVKQLVELHGGKVMVESELRKGSEFVVTLSLKKYDAKNASLPVAEVEQPEEDLGPVKVLLVEDNEMNRMLVQKVLDKWKFVTDMAFNGKQAIEKVAMHTYDIVLMDIQMPEMDGYEATQFIRRQMPPEKSSVPIIAMTAHAIMGEAEKCIALGMDDYISKPFNQKNLYDKIARLLKKETVAGTQSFEKMNGENSIGNSYIDLSYLESIAEGNKEFMKKMIQAFLLQTPVMLEDLSKFTAEKRWPELRGVVHKMKPSIDFVGIHSIREIVKELEQNAAEQKELARIPEMVRQIQHVCTKAMEELKKESLNFS